MCLFIYLSAYLFLCVKNGNEFDYKLNSSSSCHSSESYFTWKPMAIAKNLVLEILCYVGTTPPQTFIPYCQILAIILDWISTASAEWYRSLPSCNQRKSRNHVYKSSLV